MVRTGACLRNVPGGRALAFATRWFDPAIVETVFEPLVADWQRQWSECRESQRISVWISGAAALTVAILVKIPRALVCPWPAGTQWRIIKRVAFCTVALSLILMTPFAVVQQDRFPGATFLWLLMLAFPANATQVLPLAVALIADLLRTAPQPTRHERVAVLWCGVIAAAAMFILVGWVVPASRHVFGTTVTFASRGMPYRANAPRTGLLNELSILELPNDDSLNPELWRDGRELWATGRAEAVRTEIALRFAMIALPIALLWMRWRALRLPRGCWYSPLPLVLSAPLLYVSAGLLLDSHPAVADVVYAPRWLGPWLALAILTLASVGIDRLRRRAAGLS